MVVHKVEWVIGKCKICKTKNVPLFRGICEICHENIGKQAQIEGMKENQFIG